MSKRPVRGVRPATLGARTFHQSLLGIRKPYALLSLRRLCLLSYVMVGGGGGSRSRVRGFAAIGSTCLGSVYCFNRKRPGGQGAVGEPGKF